MIYTLTLNPSVDYMVGLEKVELGELNRTASEAKFPGGKGINVSRMLGFLGHSSKATGFIGGFTGRYLEEQLQAEGIQTSFISVNGDTRINVKIKSVEETEINGRGPEVSEEKLAELKQLISSLTNKDKLVLAGSIPTSLPSSIYEELIQLCKANGAEFIVDAEGGLLKRILPYGPFLIKPNHHELGQFFDKEICTADEALHFGKKLIEHGAKNVIVSLAGEGAVFINNDFMLTASVPKGTVKSSVGAGDSMVAAFLAKLEEGKNIEEAFRFSVAAGSATAFSIGLARKDQIEELISQVEITKR